TEADFSVAGQRSTANAITLDGLSLGGGSVPQDAIRSTRVVTSSYDAARGQFSGGLVASTTRSGKNIPQGSFTYTLRDRSLAWGQVTASPFGQGYTQNQLSGGMGGPNAHAAARRAVGLAATPPREPPRPAAGRRHAHGAWGRRDGVPHVAFRGEPHQRGARLLLSGATGCDRPRRGAGRTRAGRLRSSGRPSRRRDADLRRQCRTAATGRQRRPGAERRSLLAARWRRAPPQSRFPV